MDLLERAFPDNKPLVPDAAASPAAAARHSALLRLERRLFGDWLDWLVRGGSPNDFFSTLSVVEDALAAPAGTSERGNVKPTEGPYFLGEDVSLSDLVFAPFLERIAASIPYYKGVRIRGDRERFPALNRWFDAMETRESYLGTKSDVSVFFFVSECSLFRLLSHFFFSPSLSQLTLSRVCSFFSFFSHSLSSHLP